MLKYYKFKYYLNASHSFHNDPAHSHAHTFAITLHMNHTIDDFVEFTSIDQSLNEYFQSLNGRYLNNTRQFMMIEPTCENMGEYFYEDLRIRLARRKMHLMRLDISETPVRTYSISDQLLMTGEQNVDMYDNWETFMEDKDLISEARRITGKQDFI